VYSISQRPRAKHHSKCCAPPVGQDHRLWSVIVAYLTTAVYGIDRRVPVPRLVATLSHRSRCRSRLGFGLRCFLRLLGTGAGSRARACLGARACSAPALARRLSLHRAPRLPGCRAVGRAAGPCDLDGHTRKMYTAKLRGRRVEAECARGAFHRDRLTVDTVGDRAMWLVGRWCSCPSLRRDMMVVGSLAPRAWSRMLSGRRSSWRSRSRGTLRTGTVPGVDRGQVPLVWIPYPTIVLPGDEGWGDESLQIVLLHEWRTSSGGMGGAPSKSCGRALSIGFIRCLDGGGDRGLRVRRACDDLAIRCGARVVTLCRQHCLIS